MGENLYMGFLSLLSEPAIIIISLIFVFFIYTVVVNYVRLEKYLKPVYEFLSIMQKRELSYRYEQLNDFMFSNPYTSLPWEDLRKALIFPDKLFLAKQNSKIAADSTTGIYLTVDSSFFFNEESLVQSKINYKFIQTMPTILTGLGPFFTFLKMAIAFASVNLASEMAAESLSLLISNIQIAALCSVFAVGYSLIFMFLEKILYNKKCKKYSLLIQKELVRLFDVSTSEQFLLELLNLSQTQGLAQEKILKSLPEDLSNVLSKSIGEVTTPYLENILYSLNKLNESISKNSGGDVVDKLF